MSNMMRNKTTLAEQRAERNLEKLNDLLNAENTNKELVEVFKMFLHKCNEHTISISVGKKKDDRFYHDLSLTTKYFHVILDFYNDEPQFFFRGDNRNGSDFRAMFNLKFITNLSIEKIEDDKYCNYDIVFSYLKKDYNLRFCIEKQTGEYNA